VTAPADRPAWLPYIAPMAAFLLLTAAEGPLTSESRSTWYPAVYAAKIAVVAVVAWACRATWRDFRPWPSSKAMGLAISLGELIAVAWVGLDRHYPRLGALGNRAAFDPLVLPPTARFGFVAVRLAGLVVVVPLIEELFWRSFLIRWLIDADFARVPIGRVTPAAAAISAIVFALEHPEWLPGLLAGLAWAWLLHRTRSVAACLVSHATANLGLGLYVLTAHAWHFW